MGLFDRNHFKDLERSAKKAGRKIRHIVKETGYNIEKVASTPVRTARSIVRGESRTATLRELGRGLGGGFGLTGLSSTSAQKWLSSDSLNKWTLGMTKEIRNVSEGFKQMSQRKALHSSFLQSATSLGAKAAVGYYGYQYLTAPKPAFQLSSAETSGLSSKLAGESTLASSGAGTLGSNAPIASKAGILGAESTATVNASVAPGISSKLAAESTLAVSEATAGAGWLSTTKETVGTLAVLNALAGGKPVPGALSEYLGIPYYGDSSGSSPGPGGGSPYIDVKNAGLDITSVLLIGGAVFGAYLFARKGGK